MTKQRDFKASVRARMATTGESYMVARQKLLEQRAKLAAQQPVVTPHERDSDEGDPPWEDPTSIVSSGLARMLKEEWPDSMIDIVKGGLRAADEPPSDVFRSHFLLLRVPRQHGATRIEVEVRTGERRKDSSEFRVWGWINGEEDDWLDRRVDLLSEDDLGDILRTFVACIGMRIPNARAIVPGQQLRQAVEWGQWRLADTTHPVVLLDAPSLRVQDLRARASGRVPIVEKIPVEMIATKHRIGGVPTRCWTYDGPLYVDDTEERWATQIYGGLDRFLHHALGPRCIGVEVLAPREHNSVKVRAHFHVERPA